MLQLNRITNVSSALFSNVYTLYTHAFPENERRNWASLEYELNYEKRFFAHALVVDNTFVGLFNYWIFDKFWYIEHFAIIPSLRGKKIGTEVMTLFKSQTSLPIVFEIELPTDPTAIRRINFYEKLGFSIISHKYAQPPYENGNFMVPMQLMTNDTHFADTHIGLIKKTLYENVYHFETNKESSLEIEEQDLA